MTSEATKEKKEDIDDTWRPKVFIGSSSKAKGIANIVGNYLNESGEIEAIVWDKVFRITETYIEQLLRALDEYDFAILVITKDNQDEKEIKVRQNVLFELGLFMGRLGRHKAIMLCDEDQKVILPSDLEGIHRQTFSSGGDQASNEALRGYLEKPCSEIRDYILDPYEDDISVFKFWKESCKQICKALKKAPNNSTIRIIQTWLPDLEDFIKELDILLKKNKKFKFQILLINYDPDIKDDKSFDLLNARLKCRSGETRDHAIKKIEDSISQFKNLKKSVEKQWKEFRKEKLKLDLKIRQYDFLPFGPYYQIGNKEMFVGFYLNHCSSINAPMVKILPKAKTAWDLFEEHFEIGWKKSTKIRLPEPAKKKENHNANDHKKQV